MTEGQKNIIPPPFGRAGVGFTSSPTSFPREGSVDGWGKYGLRSSLLAFKTKWRKKGQKQVSPRQRLGNCSQPTFAQNGQKNYYSVHSLCHSAVGGCYSFAPFGGVSLLHPIPRALPGAGISMPLRGVTNTHPQPHSSTSEATSSITRAKLARSNFVRLHEQEPVAFPQGRGDSDG